MQGNDISAGFVGGPTRWQKRPRPRPFAGVEPMKHHLPDTSTVSHLTRQQRRTLLTPPDLLIAVHALAQYSSPMIRRSGKLPGVLLQKERADHVFVFAGTGERDYGNAFPGGPVYHTRYRRAPSAAQFPQGLLAGSHLAPAARRACDDQPQTPVSSRKRKMAPWGAHGICRIRRH